MRLASVRERACVEYGELGPGEVLVDFDEPHLVGRAFDYAGVDVLPSEAARGLEAVGAGDELVAIFAVGFLDDDGRGETEGCQGCGDGLDLGVVEDRAESVLDADRGGFYRADIPEGAAVFGGSKGRGDSGAAAEGAGQSAVEVVWLGHGRTSPFSVRRASLARGSSRGTVGVRLHRRGATRA